MARSIKERIVALGLRNIDIIKEIERRGESCYPSDFSNAINGNFIKPKYVKIVDMADQILRELEEKHNNCNNVSTIRN